MRWFHPPLSAALEIKSEIKLGETFDLELKCSYNTLDMIHKMMYGIIPDAKTPAIDIWHAYCFAGQYDIEFIKDCLKESLNKLIDNAKIPELIALIQTFGSNSPKKFMDAAFSQLVNHMFALGDEIQFCTDDSCCEHTDGRCDNELVCCQHRAVRPLAALEYRARLLMKYSIKLKLCRPQSVDEFSMRWLNGCSGFALTANRLSHDKNSSMYRRLPAR